MQATFYRGLHIVCGCAWIACAASAHAQDGVPSGIDRSRSPGDSLQQQAVTIAPTIVTATGERQRRTESSATIDAVSGREIQRTRPSHPSGIMNRIAGVHITELSAEGHSTAIRQPLTTKPMYLYLEDGVPTRATGFFNHNALYEVNIPQSDGIEVLKGPGTALYGSDAIGGVVNVFTRSAPQHPSIETSVEGGGNGYGRVLTTGGFRSGNNGVRADLNLTRSDGWRDAAPYTRQSGTVRWDYVAHNGWTAKTTATTTSVNQHDVPTLSSTLFGARSSINTAPIAFRTVRASRVAVALQKESAMSLWSITPYVRRDVLQLLPSWQLTYDPQVWDTRNNSVGMLARYRRDFTPMRARIIAGADADFSPGSFTADQAVLTTTGGTGGIPRRYVSYIRGTPQYDYDVTYRNVSPYIHSEISLLPRLRLDAGLRYDVSGYTYDTKLAPVDTGTHRIASNTSVSYRHVSPKIGATYDVASWLGLYASYRHGFRAPSQSQLFQQNSAVNTVGLLPVRANSYETGIRGEFGSRVVYSVTAYDMRINDDIVTYVTAQNTREATNAGETRHRGMEGSVGVVLLPVLRADISYSTSRQRYVNWTPQVGVAYSGNLIEQAPDHLGNLLVTYSPAVLHGGRVAMEWVDVGPYQLDAQNTHTYGGYRVMNAHFNCQVLPTAELFTRITNLTNRNYAELATYDPFQKEQYSPGNPRTVYAGVRYRIAK